MNIFTDGPFSKVVEEKDKSVRGYFRPPSYYEKPDAGDVKKEKEKTRGYFFRYLDRRGLIKKRVNEVEDGNEKSLIKVLKKGIKDEEEAIDYYTNDLIPVLDEASEVKIVKGILGDEKRHHKILSGILEEEQEELNEAVTCKTCGDKGMVVKMDSTGKHEKKPVWGFSGCPSCNTENKKKLPTPNSGETLRSVHEDKEQFICPKCHHDCVKNKCHAVCKCGHSNLKEDTVEEGRGTLSKNPIKDWRYKSMLSAVSKSNTSGAKHLGSLQDKEDSGKSLDQLWGKSKQPIPQYTGKVILRKKAVNESGKEVNESNVVFHEKFGIGEIIFRNPNQTYDILFEGKEVQRDVSIDDLITIEHLVEGPDREGSHEISVWHSILRNAKKEDPKTVSHYAEKLKKKASETKDPIWKKKYEAFIKRLKNT